MGGDGASSAPTPHSELNLAPHPPNARSWLSGSKVTLLKQDLYR